MMVSPFTLPSVSGSTTSTPKPAAVCVRLSTAENPKPSRHKLTPDGHALLYMIRGEKNEENLWLQPLDGKPGRQITHFPPEQIYGFSWSPDAKKFLVARGHIESDVVLLRDTSH